MKLLILHLSDMHLTEFPRNCINQVEKIANSLKRYINIDKLVIAVSGDLASSGQKNEYKAVKRFFGCLIDNILKKTQYNNFIYVYIVPGNHDMNYKAMKDLPKIYSYTEKDWNGNASKELDMLENFFDYASKKNSFSKNYFIDNKMINYNDNSINFSLINTAIFSRRDNDKGLHYIPPYVFEAIDANVSVSIAVMHHAPEWFLDTSKTGLEKYLRDNHDILLLGHEHRNQSKEEIFEGESSIKIVNGGVLFDPNDDKNSSYNILELDMTQNIMNIHQYAWNAKEKVYYIEQKQENIVIKKHHNKDFPLSEEFKLELQSDEKHNLGRSLDEYFVFSGVTKISQDDYSDRDEIATLEEFLDQIVTDKIVFIEGDDNSGKTSLAKILFKEYWNKGKIPVLFFSDEIKNKDAGKVLEEIFNKQYKGQYTYEKFKQADIENKILLIDDADKIKPSVFERMFISLKEEFGVIVLISQIKWEFDLKKNAKEDIEDNLFVKYKINPFYTDARKKLIKEICEIKKVDSEDDSNLVDTVNEFIKRQMIYFKFDPDFIIRFMEYSIGQNQIGYLNNNIFTQVFEASIINSLQKADAGADILQTSIILQEISYRVHVEKKYPITLRLIENVIFEYQKEYEQSVSVFDSIKLWIDAKIIKKINENRDVYKFCDTNYLAYFVAKCINRKYHNDREEDKEENKKTLEYILNNICFGINGDIVLFLSYITDNMNIIMEIYQKANEYMSDWESFDLKKNNLGFLMKCQGEHLSSEPTQEDIDKREKYERELEKRKIETLQVEILDIYDYDESEITNLANQVLKAFKYTEIIAKSLPNFYSNLKGTQKNVLKKGIYEFPNKIIFKWLKPIDQEFDDFIKEFVAELNDQGKKVTEEKIADLVIRCALAMILSLYDNFAAISVNKNSLEGLKVYVPQSINEEIQQIMIMENGHDYESFVKKLDALYDKTKHTLIKFMLRQIVTKSLVCDKDLNSSKERHLRAKYFSRQNSQILALKAKK